MKKVKYLLVMLVAVLGLTVVNACSDDDDVRVDTSVKRDTGATKKDLGAAKLDTGLKTDTGVAADMTAAAADGAATDGAATDAK